MGVGLPAFKEKALIYVNDFAIEDLGELFGPLLVFGGPYSNLHAAQALFAEPMVRSIPVSNRICTGDVVAYCAYPSETTDLIFAQTDTVVAGNCERKIADGAGLCGCGFDEGSVCDVASKNWYPFASARVDSWQNRFAKLPGIAVFTHSGKRYAVLHGGASDIARFIWLSTALDVFEEEFELVESVVGPVDCVLAGHSGLAFQRDFDAKTWINAGVIGMPPNDGDPRTQFAILEGSGVSIHRLSYDHQCASKAMIEVGLPDDYAASLANGIWPSQDILPVELRHAEPEELV